MFAVAQNDHPASGLRNLERSRLVLLNRELLHNNRSPHKTYLLIALLYDILSVRQMLESGPPGAKPIT